MSREQEQRGQRDADRVGARGGAPSNLGIPGKRTITEGLAYTGPRPAAQTTSPVAASGAATAPGNAGAASQGDAAGDKNFHPLPPSPAEDSVVSNAEHNPYTGEQRLASPGVVQHFDGPLKQLPKLIHEGKLDLAFPAYRELMNGLDLWVADQL